MAGYLACMNIQAKNEFDYEIVKNWCEHFENADDLGVYSPDDRPENFAISYDELNVFVDDAKKIFIRFAEFCITHYVTDEIQVHFDISSESCGEEWQALYILRDGEATEQISEYTDWGEGDNFDDFDGDDHRLL